MKNKIIRSKEYVESFKRLADNDQYELEGIVLRIQYGRVTNGAHREQIRVKLASGEDVYTYRVGQDLRLAAYLWKPGEYILLRCDHHDSLYKRLHRMRKVSVKECELPLFEVDVTEVATSMQMKCPQYSPTPRHLRPIQEITSDQLAILGLSSYKTQQFMECRDDDGIMALVETVDGEPLRNALLALWLGEISFSTALTMVKSAIPERRRSAEKIVKENPYDAANYFILDENNEKTLEQFKNGTLENWQVFLHPSQRTAVEMKANGPAMITGSAGTGKTVVAVHRAKWLLENVFTHGERILFTTYVTTLVDSVKAMLRKICTDEQLSRIDVVNLDAILREEWKHFRPGVSIEFNDHVYKLVAELFKLSNGGHNDARAVSEEYCDLILELNILTLEQYKNVVRPRHLRRVNREERWKLFEFLNKVYRGDNIKNTIRAAALNILADAISTRGWSPESHYASVIVDEAQDFGAPEYRFFAALTGNSFGKSVPYSLFVCGDGHQRIYNRSGTLKDCGIDVHGGRSKCLKVCYRSTQMIRQYAENVIRGVSISDMDGGDERLLDIKSLAIGEIPQERFFNSRDYVGKDAVYDYRNKYLADVIGGWHREGVRYSDIAVLLRNAGKKWEREDDESFLFKTAKSLNDLGIPSTHVGKKSPTLEGDTVKVMTMHRAKGMQFYGVAISLDGWPYQGGDGIDEDQRRAHVEKDRCLLYMAIMRATSKVVITGTRGRPKELPVYVEPRRQPVVLPMPKGEQPECTEKPSGEISVAPSVAGKMFRKKDGTLVDPNTIMTPEEQAALCALPQTEFGRRTPIQINDFLKQKMHGRLSDPNDLRSFLSFLRDGSRKKEVVAKPEIACSRSAESVSPRTAPASKVEDLRQKCPYCGCMVSRMERHLRRAHSVGLAYKYVSPSRKKRPLDPEDIQREIYGDW